MVTDFIILKIISCPFLLLFKQYMLDEEDLDEVSKNYRSDQHHTSPSDS